MSFVQAFSLRFLKIYTMADGKTVGTWLGGETLQRVQKRAGDNTSEYVRNLILNDLEGAGPDLSTKDVLVTLAKLYTPTLVEPLTELLNRNPVHDSINQQRVVAHLLEALNKYLSRGENPDTALTLTRIPSVDELVDHALVRLAQPDGLEQWQLNDPSPMYPKKKTSKKQTSGHSRSAVDVPKPA